MIEQSTENSFSQNSNIKTEQVRSQNGNKIHQKSVTDNVLSTVDQLSKQINELDRKNTRIEELISSIKKDIKNAVMSIKADHQIASDNSAKIKEFHDQITRLQMQTQKIEQAINAPKKSKKDKKNKKQNKKDKKLSNMAKDKYKKKKKKAKSMKKKKQK